MLNWDDIPKFPEAKVAEMLEIIDAKRKDSELENFFINPILKEDIFNILDACCTVIYYPFEQEENDGFHISLPVDYNSQKLEHFVFINTEKHLDKQVFTVGHELGHLWEVADIIWDEDFKEILEDTDENIEAAMNRFAAELLVPKDLFLKMARTQLRSNQEPNGKIKLLNVIRVIASLMNEFCVPKQAIIRRFYEVGCFSEKTCRMLWMGPEGINSRDYQKDFTKALEACIREGGYTRLESRTRKKGIKDFPKILSEVERKQIFSIDKVKYFRNEFDIPEIQLKEENQDVLLEDSSAE